MGREATTVSCTYMPKSKKTASRRFAIELVLHDQLKADRLQLSPLLTHELRVRGLRHLGEGDTGSTAASTETTTPRLCRTASGLHDLSLPRVEWGSPRSERSPERVLCLDGDDGSAQWLRTRAGRVAVEWLKSTNGAAHNSYATAFGQTVLHALAEELYTEVGAIARQYTDDFEIELEASVTPKWPVRYIMAQHIELSRRLDDNSLHGFYMQVAMEMLRHARAARAAAGARDRRQDATTGAPGQKEDVPSIAAKDITCRRLPVKRKRGASTVRSTSR